MHLAIFPCVQAYIKHRNTLKYGALMVHSLGAHVPKCVHPAAKLCAPGAGCALNFEHCHQIKSEQENITISICKFKERTRFYNSWYLEPQQSVNGNNCQSVIICIDNLVDWCMICLAKVGVCRDIKPV